MELTTILKSLGISFGLGLVVGLQRERVESPLAGIRTFPLITMFGTICGLLGQSFGHWVVAMGLAGISAIVVAGNFLSVKARELDPGLTTEVAMLLMFGLGAYLVEGQAAVAIVVGGCVAVLLHLKPEMHHIATRIGDHDFRAIMQFVLISLVILPVLPDETYGPYQVLNPFRIWLMVVLIVGMSLGGYVVYKWFGKAVGALIGGLLGGLISSTATTISYARSTRSAPQASEWAAFAIVVATGVSFARVLALIAATAPGLLQLAAAPLSVMFGVVALCSGVTWFAIRKQSTHLPQYRNPSELRPALLFGAVFAIVLVSTAAAKDFLGQGGLYAVAVLSGLTDMDAITLSVTQMTKGRAVESDTAWRLILTAALANLVFKAGAVGALGNRRLALWVGVLFGIVFVAGLLVLTLWPATVQASGDAR